MTLDPPTILALTVALAAAAALYLLVEWRSVREPSLLLWSSGFATITIGSLLALLRINGFLVIGIWFAITFVSTWFARDFDFWLFGWPVSFYLAAQGVPILYIVLVTWYGRRMERLDRRYGVEERDLS